MSIQEYYDRYIELTRYVPEAFRHQHFVSEALVDRVRNAQNLHWKARGREDLHDVTKALRTTISYKHTVDPPGREARGQRWGRAAAANAGGLWCRGLWLCGARREAGVANGSGGGGR